MLDILQKVLSLDYAQPLYMKGKFHTIALVHNGQIIHMLIIH